MKIFWAWLAGMCMGVGSMIWTKGMSTSQAHMMRVYIVGVVLGMAAVTIASAPWTEDDKE